MADLPVCRNKNCPNFQNNSHITLQGESTEHWLFYCDTCKGIEYRTKPSGWQRATQENSYRRKGRPEYARTKAIFGYGKSRT